MQASAIIKAQQVIQKLNEENKELVQQLEAFNKRWDQLEIDKGDSAKLQARIEEYK